MKIRKHYLALRRCFPQLTEDVPLETTLDELSQLLDCTHRNMVLLLKRMQQEGWLSWVPKKGRGNRSTLLFTARQEHILMLEAQEMVHKQNLRSALELLQTYEASLTLREQFQDWLSGQFGFRSEVQGQRRTDILRFPLAQSIHSLDPASMHYSGESHLVNQLFDGLVRMDARGQLILPHLALGWDTDDSRTLWTFYLRKGVQFHHGREMLSSDVKFSLERLQKLAPRGLFSWAYTNIAAMETPDDTTIRIRLRERNELFLGFLTTSRASIVPQDICEAAEGGLMGVSPVGTGPFRLIGHEHGIWQLDAFPSYFQGRGFLDRVEVWTVPDGERREEQELAIGPGSKPLQEMHHVRVSDMTVQQWKQARQSGMTAKFITVNEHKAGLFTQAPMRHALQLALDRRPLSSLLPADCLDAGNSFLQQKSSHDMLSWSFDTVVDHLRAAGYQGELFTLATIPQYESDAILIQQLCTQAGIQLDIELLSAEDFKGEARLKADLLLFAVVLDEHRELRLVDLYKSMQEHAIPQVREQLETALQRLVTEPDPAQRLELLASIEDGLLQRHSLLFLYKKHLKTAFHPSIRGISLDSLGWVRFRDIWFT
ncbi:ABC transporter substrate-binding protein [Paenibacillus aestuarii]|uniref:ABC transporter substrate-binding protein n=1 Tax=Paenibacillus aestuarii TaxID=516965 RepID=A0ABW0K586_9BACL|nr:ABC transporter substrate-binding protein [Paenibacillus aestuarii]